MGSCLITSDFSETSPEFLGKVTHKRTLWKQVCTEPLGLWEFWFQIIPPLPPPQSDSAPCHGRSPSHHGTHQGVSSGATTLLLFPSFCHHICKLSERKLLGWVFNLRIDSSVSECLLRNFRGMLRMSLNTLLEGVLVFVTFLWADMIVLVLQLKRGTHFSHSLLFLEPQFSPWSWVGCSAGAEVN